MRQAIDDLPSVSVSRLRASGEIGAETKVARVGFGEVSFNVALALRRFSMVAIGRFSSAPAAGGCEPCAYSRAGLRAGSVLGLAGFALGFS